MGRLITIFLVAFLGFTFQAFSQDCPTFRVKVDDKALAQEDKRVEITIRGGGSITLENFRLRQTAGPVEGDLDFEVKAELIGNKLIYSGLKKSEELQLEQYVVQFFHKSCQNGKMYEVAKFKIN